MIQSFYLNVAEGWAASPRFCLTCVCPWAVLFTGGCFILKVCASVKIQPACHGQDLSPHVVYKLMLLISGIPVSVGRWWKLQVLQLRLVLGWWGSVPAGVMGGLVGPVPADEGLEHGVS